LRERKTIKKKLESTRVNMLNLRSGSWDLDNSIQRKQKKSNSNFKPTQCWNIKLKKKSIYKKIQKNQPKSIRVNYQNLQLWSWDWDHYKKVKQKQITKPISWKIKLKNKKKRFRKKNSNQQNKN
jgi:hypothetical protein